ncbi:MAG: 50S ribosomal protein L11 methyltransferase [Flavobacteriales bacterium]|nr:50S ribosomal protein L11 methyltransferase [Flavobacteriales bacterium]MBK6945856.1 50S ribosomal protein L11 methyltransferase [Flavobacteriales bacterium]MBK7239212.1 50S ribosomal protein L11 methyltransferase [Flavobacteriales bacterium]MBK7298520.1 50S ribosomal protein L11 methyltransferase [Flavobacteriales bacterium]MBK9536682.1 50S ribosomal protein L11 methyltransferase [Flavobacteriales bacterium]
MTYTEVTFRLAPVDPWRDILMVELGELGYDSFDESFTDPSHESGELKAYIKAEQFDASALRKLMTLRDPHVNVTWTKADMPARNWNAEWESSFQPVEVGSKVRIRADFHPSKTGFEHELVITPRMAFGTGHHATTRMMVLAMLDVELKNKSVCDLGCGTGVLAILAERMGASSCVAIDIDPDVMQNGRENVLRNNCEHIVVETGDAQAMGDRRFDAILANIERNTLLEAMQLMYDALLPGGLLFLSGFVVTDRHMLIQRAKEVGLTIHERLNEGDWALLGCRRPLGQE